MLKNNLFFGKLESFGNKTALILENNKRITYKDLLLISKKISKQIDKEKKLIFLLGQNNLESIAGYISFIKKGHTVTFLDSRINKFFLDNLVKLYKPNYIFCEKK